MGPNPCCANVAVHAGFPSAGVGSRGLTSAAHPDLPPQVFPRLCPDGIDLMQRMFEYDPAKRITVGAGVQERSALGNIASWGPCRPVPS